MLVSMFARFKRPRRLDPIFGQMVYMGDDVNYWEAKATFPPTATVVEMFVDGNAVDDFEEQHLFFDQLVESWPRIRAAIMKYLAERTPSPGSSRAGPSAEGFMISSLTIPKRALDDAEWEISLTNQLDSEHVWAIAMQGFDPTGITVDG